jgi:hypothetical protein
MDFDTQVKLAAYRRRWRGPGASSPMLFFRSEEQVGEWCAMGGHPLRPLVTMRQLWGLAHTWYATRLQETSRRPKPDEMVAIFAGLGLEGEFWNPLADSFGLGGR